MFVQISKGASASGSPPPAAAVPIRTNGSFGLGATKRGTQDTCNCVGKKCVHLSSVHSTLADIILVESPTSKNTEPGIFWILRKCENQQPFFGTSVSINFINSYQFIVKRSLPTRGICLNVMTHCISHLWSHTLYVAPTSSSSSLHNEFWRRNKQKTCCTKM